MFWGGWAWEAEEAESGLPLLTSRAARNRQNGYWPAWRIPSADSHGVMLSLPACAASDTTLAK